MATVPCTNPEHRAPGHVPDDLLRVLAAGRPRFLAFARKRVGSAADAEDVLQEAMTRASTRLVGLRDCASLEAWFFRVIRSVVADHVTKARAESTKRRALTEDPALAPAVVADEPAATCACSLDELGKLKDGYREIVERVDVGEEPLADVASALGVTTNNAGVRLHRARKALREALLDRCGTTSSARCLACGCDPVTGAVCGDAVPGPSDAP